ncbi:family 78 glycoside hydrolase catalytic domain [Actinomyces oricola]
MTTVPAAPTHLTVDHQHAPIGVAVARPALAWQVPGTNPATAYEVEVRRLNPLTGTPLNPPVWATGRVEVPAPPMTPWLVYDGEPLASDADYTWRVRVWTQADGGPTEPADNQATTPPDEKAAPDCARPPATTDTIPAPGSPSDWATSTFSTSLLDPGLITAPWAEPTQEPIILEPKADFATLFAPQERPPAGERLHPVKLVRQDITIVGAPVVRARLYTSAQGVIEVSLDGSVVGDTVLAPGWTSYHVYTHFDVHDVTEQLSAPGAHTLAIALGDGWYGGRMTVTGESGQYGTVLRAWWQLSLTRADGSTQVLGPDASARSTTAGPLRHSDIMIGERRDDRLAAAIAGWDRPGFDDSSWEPVRVVPSTELDPATRLEPFRGEPVRRLADLPAREIVTTARGETVVDFGQVIAGRVRISAVGPAGTEILLEHSEHLDAEGNFFSNVQGPNKDQRDTWVLAGTGTVAAPETYEPTFTFHGFRYVKVSGYPGTLAEDAVSAVVIGSDLPPTGTFACSDKRLERLHSNTVWSQRANFLSIPTDCPQRERAGWTGDIQVFAPAATNNAEVHTFLARWLENLRVDQKQDGRIPIISPYAPAMAAMENLPGIGGITAAAGWGDAVIRVPLALWERYGDADTLAACYPAMQAWVDMQSRQAGTELPSRLRTDPEDATSGWEALEPQQAARQRLLWNSRLHFGDWLAPSTLVPNAKAPVDGEVPDAGLSDPIMVAPILTSELVGAAFHAQALRTIAHVAQVLGRTTEAAAYRERWEAVRSAVGAEYVAEDGSMSPDLQGMYVLALAFDLVPEGLRDAAAAHLVRLVREADDHLDTGFLSIPFLLDVLEATGHTRVAWELLLQDTMPSWLYEVVQGATTIWESWAAVAPDGTVGAMSFNHYAFGAVDDWMFRRLAGIDAAEPGFRRVRVAPLVDGPLSWACGERLTPYGRVRVRWERQGEGASRVVTSKAVESAESGALEGTAGSEGGPSAAGTVEAPGQPVRYEIELPAGVTGELVGADGVARALGSGRTVLTI